MSRIVGIIPARLDSSRLPGKLLLSETGKPLIVHTIEQAQKSHLLDEVIVATGDQEIAEACKKYCRVVLTEWSHENGTSRVNEVCFAEQYPDSDIAVNIQGDEPEINPKHIDQVILAIQDAEAAVATVATPARRFSDLDNPDRVKVVISHGRNALMFSRGMIPYPVDVPINEDLLCPDYPKNPFLLHTGIYAYRVITLNDFNNMPRSHLENTEHLEQLRFLQNGYNIKVVIVPEASGGINSLTDYDAFVDRETSIRDTQTH